ncbi:MAG: adenylyltransferase/cytidyltransferase family protein, partial [Firmicutes bacterium]|nr:adenylyltransferase/cytidyltransferase family protein [Bacillota bacterium]
MKTVITYGVFDLFHEGHVSLLKRAKELGDRLIVGVTTDQFAYKRGKYSVIDPVEKRFENVRSCPYVDQVIIEDHYGQKVEDIARFGVDIFAIGDDWLGKFDHLSSLCRVVYLKRTPNISSTELRCGSLPFLRLGMIGCGRIAGRFMQEAGYVRDVQVTSLYHPSPDTSATVQRFREKHTGIGLARTLD